MAPTKFFNLEILQITVVHTVVVHIIWFAEFVQAMQLHICQNFCPYIVNFLL